jgi:hypothetical protein
VRVPGLRVINARSLGTVSVIVADLIRNHFVPDGATTTPRKGFDVKKDAFAATVRHHKSKAALVVPIRDSSLIPQ